MNRRNFLVKAAALTSTALISGAVPFKVRGFSSPASPDMVVWKGLDYYQGVREAIDTAGGIARFVPKNSIIGLLVNSQFDFQPALVKPDITIAMIELLAETEPKEIVLLQVIHEEYWNLSPYAEKIQLHSHLITQVESNIFPSVYNDQDFTVVDTIEGAKYLQNAEIVKRFLDVDVFINMPVIKHHATTLLTGALKNMMGISSRKTNVGFHIGPGEKNDPGYLGQCIADLSILRKPDLVVADATELIVTNGPAGPGETVKPDTLIVSPDPVAVDAFGCRYLDLFPEDIHAIVCAHEAGLGEMHLDNLNILECSS